MAAVQREKKKDQGWKWREVGDSGERGEIEREINVEKD